MPYFQILKETVADWMEDKAMRLSAALAYYSTFSLAPLLLIAISVAGLVFGREAVQGQVDDQLRGTIGPEAAGAVQSMLEGAAKSEASGLMAVVGVVLLLLSASGVFGQLKDALNTIWEIEMKPGRGVWGFLKDRFLSMAMVLVVGFLLLVSLLLTTAVTGMSDYLGSVLPVPEAAWHILTIVISFAVVTLLFAMIFKFLPDAKVQWNHVWLGAVITAVLFAIGKYGLALYLGREGATSSYGAAGAFILILMWVYYSSLILLFGAEFTQVYARHSGHRIEPDTDAVKVTEATRAQQGMASEATVREADRTTG